MYLYKDGRKIRSEEHFKFLSFEVSKTGAIAIAAVLTLMIIIIAMMLLRHGRSSRRR
jgi:hypothetical protein